MVLIYCQQKTSFISEDIGGKIEQRLYKILQLCNLGVHKKDVLYMVNSKDFKVKIL